MEKTDDPLARANREPPMLILHSDRLMARIDPRHGAEVLDLIDLQSGRQLLGRPPFGSTDRRAGPLSESQWLEGWRGGWQVCVPNAGSACTVGGVRHGFHGTASQDAWEVLEAGEAQAALRWCGHGLEVLRSFTAAGAELVVEVELRSRSDQPVPVVVVEHVSFGLEMLDPELRLELPKAAAIELSELDGPIRAPAAAPTWPHVLHLDQRIERGDLIELRGEPRADLFCVQDLPEGRAVARGGRAAVELTWDAGVLPHAWVWIEIRGSRGPFRGLSEVVAVEPSSVPHSLGLARAIEEGQAIFLGARASRCYRFGARIIR